jgi:NAD(P)-dependent dehydrogenase (short-subunit alcohol dehydrogenase family)
MKYKHYLDNLFSLQDKIVVVTGASGLLGRMHTEAIAGQGGIPIILDINKKGLNELSEYIFSEYAIKPLIQFVDITKESQVALCSETIIQKYGKIDGLVNNAARNPTISKNNKINFSRLENFDLESWEQDLSISLTGSFLCSKYFGHKISLNKNGGSIVNISSDLAIIAPDQRIYEQENIDDDDQPVKPISYSVVKSGLLGLSKYISSYWAKKNVRSNCLLPGGIRTDQDEVFVSKLESLIPLQRMAVKNEYQGALIFLLSDASKYMTGTNLIVDGGRSAW